MLMHWTEAHIKELERKGRIRGYKAQKRNKESNPARKIVSKRFKKRSKEKDWISQNLLYWCNEHALQLQEEYKFHSERKWRFDWAIPALKIGIEYEGLISAKSRHTTISGFSKDTEKYNAAQQLGWTVLRYTALNYEEVIKNLNFQLKNNVLDKRS